MFSVIFGDKTTKIQVLMAVGAAVVAVYEAITTIKDYQEEKENANEDA
jgi:thiamine monophosphate synthase